MFRSGQEIGPYTLIKRIGRGGFGEVWLAERRAKFVTTQVAVKLPLDEQIDHAAIEHEAQLWARASGHSNILPIIEANEYDGQVVIVSEYTPDGSLEEWLRVNGKMPVEKAAKITVQILDGLEFLHSRKIIHRDLKPANILLQGNTPRLADFGISRALRTTSESLVRNVSGTLAYMSPEAFDGERSVQTDIWAVGVNLYQFLTGTLPFPQSELSALFSAILSQEFNPLPDFVPDGLQKIIWNALIKLPENRYKSADEMREDLQHYLSGNSGNIMRFPAQQVAPTEPSLPIPPSVSTVTDIEITLPEGKKPNEGKDKPQFLVPSEIGFIEPPDPNPPPPPVKIKNWLISGAALIALTTAFVIIQTQEIPPNPILVTSSPKINSANSISPQTLTSTDYFNRAIECGKNKNYDCAIENYTKSIDLNPSDSASYNNRGIAYYDKGEYDMAIADYSKAIQLKPDYAGAYYNRGISYKDRGNYESAIADYSKAIELKPDYAKAYSGRGIAYLNESNNELAIADYNKAIELEPDVAYNYNNRGMAYENKQQYESAMANYSKAIELKPDYANAYKNRGDIYSAKGDYDKAITDYRKALAIEPDNKKAKENLDTALGKQAIRDALNLNKR